MEKASFIIPFAKKIEWGAKATNAQRANNIPTPIIFKDTRTGLFFNTKNVDSKKTGPAYVTAVSLAHTAIEANIRV